MNTPFREIEQFAQALKGLPTDPSAAVGAPTVPNLDDRAVAFYRHFGFTPSPTDTRHLFMIIKDIRLAAGQRPGEIP